MNLARTASAVIINADSMQVYRDFSILTARPRKKDMNKAVHRLYGTVDGGEACSVARWLADAMAEIECAWQAGQVPILVGGTGLYFRALLHGLSPVPDIPDEIRDTVRNYTSSDLYDTLQREDPAMAAKLHPTDRQRAARALEVSRASGKSLLEWQAMNGGGLQQFEPDLSVTKIIITLPREELYARCNARFAAMLEEGAIGEVQTLIARKLSSGLPVMKAIGVPEITGHLAGDLSREDVIRLGSQATRRYAKRQLTWFRNQCADWVWYDGLDEKGLDHADLL